MSDCLVITRFAIVDWGITHPKSPIEITNQEITNQKAIKNH
jgi:hypothetical protein